MFNDTHSTPMWECSSSLHVTFRGMQHCNLCNGSVVHSSNGLYSDVSDFAVLSTIRPMFQFPRIAFGVWTYYKIIYSNISFLCVPFLSWNQRRKYIPCPPLPKRVHNFLNKFNSGTWILGFSEWALWHVRRWSSKQYVIRTKVWSIMRVVWNAPNWSLINEVRHFQQACIQLKGCQHLLPNSFL